MISVQALVNAVVILIVLGLIYGLLFWLIENVGIPDPFRKMARTVLIVFGVLSIIYLLLWMVGAVGPLFRLEHSPMG